MEPEGGEDEGNECDVKMQKGFVEGMAECGESCEEDAHHSHPCLKRLAY